MNFGTYFAEAHSDYSHAKYIILGIPFDLTQSFRPGSRFAPNRIREASWNLESYSFDYGVDISEVPIHDMGNVDVEYPHEILLTRIGKKVSEIVQNGKFPIILGGEHSITLGCVSSLKNINVVILDAHLDMREEFDGSKLNHACVTRRLLELRDEGIVKEIILAGVRCGTKEETEKLDDITVFSAKDLMIGMDDLLSYISGLRNVYISLDMDCFDPSIAPAVSTPEPGGIEFYQAMKILERIAENSIALDLVEVVPDYDNGNTSILSARIIRDFIAMREKTEG